MFASVVKKTFFIIAIIMIIILFGVFYARFPHFFNSLYDFFAIIFSIVIFVLNIGALLLIYLQIFVSKVFLPVTFKKIKILFLGIIAGLFYAMAILGVDHGNIILEQEELENLTRQEGVLTYVRKNKSSYYELKMQDGSRCELKFFSDNHVSEYENKNVTIWRKNRYVYQMESNKRMVFDLNESNDNVFFENFLYINWWLFLFFVGLIIMLISMEDSKKIEPDNDI